MVIHPFARIHAAAVESDPHLEALVSGAVQRDLAMEFKTRRSVCGLDHKHCSLIQWYA
jgi:hypothetical protein